MKYANIKMIMAIVSFVVLLAVCYPLVYFIYLSGLDLIPDPDANLDLNTLYKTVSPQTWKNVTAVSSLYYNDKRAVVFEKQEENRNIIFANLETGTVKSVPLNSEGNLSIVQEGSFFPANRDIILLYKDYQQKEGQGYKTYAFKMDENGNLKPLEIFNLKKSGVAEDIIKVKDLILNEKIKSLTEIKSKIMTKEMAQGAIDLEEEKKYIIKTDLLFDNNYLLLVDETEEIFDELKAITKESIENDYTQYKTPEIEGLSIEVKRFNPENYYTEFENGSYIKNIVIKKDEEVIKEYNLQGVYFQITIQNDRLYLIGNSIKYIEITDLIPEDQVQEI